MKKNQKLIKLVSLSPIVFTTLCSGSIEAFHARAATTFSINMVESVLCNDSYDVPLQCQAIAYGQLNTGISIQSTTDLYLLPHQCKFAYVYSNYPFFFINGYGDGNCIPTY